MMRQNNTSHNRVLAKEAVLCSANTFVVKIATFAKPETVIIHLKEL
jgi:hypothetical protein